MAKKSKQELLEDEASFSDSVEKELDIETPEDEVEVEEPGEEPEGEPADKTEEPEGEPAPSTKVKIGDVEYDPDELNTLLEKGKFAKKVEEEQKIDISQLYPEFTKRSQLIKNPEALKQFAKETYGFNVEEKPLSDEDKALKEQIERAREAGFLTKEDKQDLIGEVMKAIEVREVGKAVEAASAKYGIDQMKLIDFMSFLNTRDAESAAEKMATYQKMVSAKPTPAAPTPTSKKPEVLKTETKGTGVRIPPKEKPVPHPDKDPEGFAAAIASFFNNPSPEDSE